MRSKPLILAFAAAVLLAVAAFQATDLWWQRTLAVQTAETRVSTQSTALAEYIRGSFAAADAALRQLALHAQRIGGARGPSTEWLPTLEAVQAALNERGSLSVTDRDGIIRHSTLPQIVGQSRRSHYLFQELSRANPGSSLTVDVPFASPFSPNVYVLPLGRRLQTPSGDFDGIVVQVVNPESFRPFFQTLRIGQLGAIWVFHPDGALVFREPSTAHPPGEDARNNLLFQAALGGETAGVYRGPLAPGGRHFISAYRVLDGPRLVVAVSHDEAEALADWKRSLYRAAIEIVALAAIMAVLLVVVFRQMRARSAVERALADVQRTEAERLREANDRLEGALLREMQAREESESASRMKDEFLMTLSHELRTPLNAILGWAHMLSTGNIPEDQRDRALAAIERNAGAQAHLIEGLLDVSRTVSGKLQLHLSSISVADPVGAAAETLRPAMTAKRIQFTCDVEGGLPAVQGDPDRLQQVVWNLLSNAIKFTPPGGRVSVRVGATDAGVEIVVSDSGCGIPPAFLPYVFERFRQADAGPRREHGGLGLGLAIARHLVELHGGTISVDSGGEDQGSTFRIVLPAQPELAVTRGSSLTLPPPAV